MGRPAFHCLPKFEAGCQMPSHASITLADANIKTAAQDGSERLLRALLFYGCRHGLPNITPDQCRARLGL